MRAVWKHWRTRYALICLIGIALFGTLLLYLAIAGLTLVVTGVVVMAPLVKETTK